MTLIEVLLVVGSLIVLIALWLPALTRSKHGPARMSCFDNMRQVTLGFRIWAGDNGDKYPMQVSTNMGGSMEYASGPNAFRHFLVISNKLNTPKIVFCPQESDKWRTTASTFGSVPPGSTLPYGVISFASNTNLSYFVAPATTNNAAPRLFLMGDHNITNGTRIVNGILNLTSNRLSGWTHEIHEHRGNIGLADGSVQTLSTPALRNALTFTETETNRLQMP